MKLFCLAHAGGSAQRLARVLGTHLPDAETVPLVLAGRGVRANEPAYEGWQDATHDLASRLAGSLDGSAGGGTYGIVGHSFGALLGHELAHRMRELGQPQPGLLVVAGRNPPHLPPGPSPLRAGGMSDEDLFAALVAIGGASPRAAGPLTYRTFLPPLRNDLRMALGYKPPAERAPLGCRMVVLYGREDPLTSGTLMPQWGRYTSGRFELHAFQGDHFFVVNNAREVAPVISQSVSFRAQAA